MVLLLGGEVRVNVRIEHFNLGSGQPQSAGKSTSFAGRQFRIDDARNKPIHFLFGRLDAN